MAKKVFIAVSLLVILFLLLAFNVEPALAKDKHKSQIKIYDNVENRIAEDGAIDVIIIATDIDTEDFEKRIEEDGVVLENAKTHDIIQGISGRLTRDDLEILKSSGIDMQIYEDSIFYADAKGSGEELRTSLAISTRIVGANYSWEILNLTGRNITIAVIDTGIDYNHPDLGGCLGSSCKVLGGYDFINNDSDPMDDNGHGTHVAGIISANGTIKGVAPDSKLYALKACAANSACASSRIISAIEWALNNSADIISISIGGSYSAHPFGNSGKDLTSVAVDAAVNAGAIVVIAAGNTGSGASTINAPGASLRAITVGSVNDQGTIDNADDIILSSSSRGPGGFGRFDPEISAPGFEIISTYLNNGSQALTGTSMAAPHVSGAAALLLENDPTLTPIEIRAILMNSANNISGKAFDKGAGELNIRNALENNAYVLVESEDLSLTGAMTTNDRWEFVALDEHYANFTIFNNNNFPINFSYSYHAFENQEDSSTLNASMFSVPQISVDADSTVTFQINFTLNNASKDDYGTYGGYIIFEAEGALEINLSVPVAITIPIRNYCYVTRTLLNSGETNGDVVYYAYYNTRSQNHTFRINWSGASNDLDLYLYNSTWHNISHAGYVSTNNESIVNSDLAGDSTLRWMRVHGFEFSSSPFKFTVNITDHDNAAPNITGVYYGEGSSARLNTNITLEINYSDSENDDINITLNDTSYNLINNSEGRAFYNKYLDASHNITITLLDNYGARYSYLQAIIAESSLSIDEYSPNSGSLVIQANSSIDFSQQSSDSDNNTIYFYWYVNEALNSTSQNFTFNSSLFNGTSFNITFIVSNNETNESVAWSIHVDGAGPVITINNTNISSNSTITIRYNLSDLSNISSCWYELAGINHSISLCQNFTLYLANGQYNLTIYANDSYGYLGSNALNLRVNDTTPPVLSGMSPSTRQDPDDDLTLSVTTSENASCKYSEEDVSYANMNRGFIDNIYSHTKDFDPDPSEEYIFYVRCNDTAGNANNASAIIGFNTSAKDSGGGGRTGTYRPPIIVEKNTTTPTNVSVREYSNFIVESTEAITVNNTVNTMSMYGLLITLNNRVSGVSLNIREPENMPASVNSFYPDRKRYSSIEIAHDGLSDSSIRDVTMRFRVSKNWMVINGIGKSDIALYRYSTGSGNPSWNILSTSFVGEQGDKYIYESTSPGLSLFLIAQKNPSVPNQQIPGIEGNRTSNNISGQKSAESKENNGTLIKKSYEDMPLYASNSTGKESSEADDKNGSLLWIIITSLIVLLGISWIYVQLKHPGWIKKKSSSEKKSEDSKHATNPIAEEYRQIINTIKKEYYEEGKKLDEYYDGLMSNIDAHDPDQNNKVQQLHIQHHNNVMQLHSKYKTQAENVRKIMSHKNSIQKNDKQQ